jgi:hypothetical protein
VPIVGGEDAFCSQLNRLLSEFYGAGIVHWVVFLVDVCENYLDFKEAYPDEHPREEGPIGCAEQPRDDQEAKAGSISGFGLTTDEVDDVRDSFLPLLALRLRSRYAGGGGGDVAGGGERGSRARSADRSRHHQSGV